MTEDPVDEDLSEGAGTGFTRRPANTSDSTPGLGWLKKRRRNKKEENALEKGYIRWHVVSDSISKPMYIRPRRRTGGNVPEFEHEGETYLFPESAMIPDAEDGIWTVIHRKGKAEPIDLRESDGRLDANSLNEYLTMRVTSDDPSGMGLPGLGNLTTKEIMQYGFLILVVAAIAFTLL